MTAKLDVAGPLPTRSGHRPDGPIPAMVVAGVITAVVTMIIKVFASTAVVVVLVASLTRQFLCWGLTL